MSEIGGAPQADPIATVSVSDIVAEARLAEQQARDLALRLQVALDAGGLGTWHWDRATDLADADDRLEALFGLPAGGLAGGWEQWAQRLHPDDRAEVLATLEQALRKKSPFQIRHRVVWPDGSVHWLATWGRVVLDGQGQVTGTVGCAADVTERMAAELEMRRTATAASEAAARERLHRERLELLNRINDVLGDATDRGDIMRRATEAAVPRLGDWCSIFVVDDVGSSPEVAVAHVDPAMVAYASELAERFPFDPAARHGVARVIRSGRPELYRDITSDLLAGLEAEPELLQVVRDLGLRSAMVVPLTKRGRTIGAMQLVLASPGRTYTDEDLALAQAAAGRIASSLENRRLSDRQRLIAQTLQRSLLPEALPDIAGVDLAVRYWAAGEGSEVGGDFYDVFAVDDDRFAVVIGDVCGTGPQAAAVTALARHTIRASAWHGDDPPVVLDHLNRALLRSRPDTFCTVVYAVGQLAGPGLQLTMAVGGHPLPILVRADGSVGRVGQPGLLVGVFEEAAYHSSEVALAGGSTLVLYSDGATDLPPPHGISDEQLATLLAADVAAADDPEVAADAIADLLQRHLPFPQRHDDIALLVLRAEPAARSR